MLVARCYMSFFPNETYLGLWRGVEIGNNGQLCWGWEKSWHLLYSPQRANWKARSVCEIRRLAEHAYARISSLEDHLKGSMAIKMAFSCTCQPNIKDPRAQMTRQRKNPLAPLGLCHILKRAGCKGKRVKMIHTSESSKSTNVNVGNEGHTFEYLD